MPKLCYFLKIMPSVTEIMLLEYIRKFKITSSLTLSILTLIYIHIVHLPLLQSLASQIRMCAPPKAKKL